MFVHTHTHEKIMAAAFGITDNHEANTVYASACSESSKSTMAESFTAEDAHLTTPSIRGSVHVLSGIFRDSEASL